MYTYTFEILLYGHNVELLCRYRYSRRSPGDVVVNVLDCHIVESEFEFRLRYYVHFWNNTLEKCMNLFILLPPQAVGSIVPLLLFNMGGFDIK